MSGNEDVGVLLVLASVIVMLVWFSDGEVVGDSGDVGTVVVDAVGN